MVTARNSLDQLEAGVSTRANLLSYFNSNLDIIDAALAKCNWAAATDPGVGDDSADGYVTGSWWWNVTGHRLWQCESASAGAAVWRQVWPAINAGPLLTIESEGSTYCDVYLKSCSDTVNGAVRGYRARGTLASPTPPQTNDVLVQLTGRGYKDGWIHSSKAMISMQAAETWDTNKYGTFITFSNTIIANATAAERMRITKTGGIAIGSTADVADGSLYVLGDVNCASVTDHTPMYVGDAITALNKISAKGDKIDHASLPAFTQRKYTDEEGNEKIGRDLGAMISLHTVAIQQLAARDAPDASAQLDLKKPELRFVVGDGVNDIVAGVVADIPINIDLTINRVTLLGTTAGSVVVDIQKCAYSAFDASAHPVAGDTICASTKPTITKAVKYQDATLTGWTKTFSANDVMRIVLNSISGFKKLTIGLDVA